MSINTMQFTFVTSLLLGLTSIANAQGTATGPSTAHEITSAGLVFIGGPNDTINGPGPIGIDLDVNGPPWRKGLFAGAGGFGGGPITLRETIRNTGTEPWTDWHEIKIDGSHGTVWDAVTRMRINGTPITFDANISGNTIDLDNFSQQVLPGDILQIEKRIQALTDNFVQPGTLVVSVLEYPTTNVPEPASVVLVACCVAGGLLWRRL